MCVIRTADCRRRRPHAEPVIAIEPIVDPTKCEHMYTIELPARTAAEMYHFNALQISRHIACTLVHWHSYLGLVDFQQQKMLQFGIILFCSVFFWLVLVYIDIYILYIY